MAKKKPPNWELAKALFGQGRPLREIGDECNIPFNTVRDRAKKEGWIKGELVQTIADVAKAKEEIYTKTVHLSRTESDIVEEGSNLILESKGIHLKGSLNLAKMAVKFALTEQTTKGVLQASQALLNTARLSGVVDYYPPKEQLKEQQAIDNMVTVEIIGVSPDGQN